MRTSLLSALAAALSATMCVGLGPSSPMPRTVAQTAVLQDSAPMRLGMMGPYDLSQAESMKAAGVTDLLLEISWPRAEPSQGVFDETYLASIRQQAVGLESAGFQVALNAGLMNAPAWLLALPGALFVDQNGNSFTDDPVPNFVFGTSLRPLAQQYLNELFAVAGTSFSNVRAGGGIMGELSYPYQFDSTGKVRNLYWAFDANARAQDPVPGWRPGSASPHGEATTFLSWYLNRLASFQNWQVGALRTAGYQGNVAMLYPSYGMRPGDFTKAVSTNLGGTSSPEINGEVQRGYDFARQITALTDPKTVIYSTWGDNPAPVNYLAGLAFAKRLGFMAENGGGNSATQIDTALKTAAAAGATTFYLVRAPQFFCSCSGYATLAQAAKSYRDATAITPASVPAAPGAPAASAPSPAPTSPAPSGPTGSAPVAAPVVPAKKAVHLLVKGKPTSLKSRLWAGSVTMTTAGGARPTGRIQLLLKTASGTVVVQTTNAALPAGGVKVRVKLPKSGACWLSLRYLGDPQFLRAGSSMVRIRS